MDMDAGMSILGQEVDRDPLTGVLSGQSFRHRMQQLYGQKQAVHVIAVNLPQVKQINRIFGGRWGDLYLCEFATCFKNVAGPQSIFRLSGKRFALVADSICDYEKIRKGVMDFMEGTLNLEGESVPVAGTICGIVNAQEFGDPDTLISYIEYLAALAPKTAERLLVQSDGRTKQVFLKEKEIERYLRTAIEEDLFELYYQPIFSVKMGRYDTLEALSRLRHPALGFIPPDLFIRIAEQNGQIVRIGQMQFGRVCRFVKMHPWLMGKVQNIKFNLSPAELLREGCGRRFLETIREWGLPYSFFQFEITETVATEYSGRLYEVVKEFETWGIRLSLDDFGSGYANLDTVLKLPFTSVKLDRSLLNDIRKEEKARIFYKNMVAVLQNMGYSVISEGAENKIETELLTSWGVDMIQGYYFSRPLPPDELLKLFSDEEP